MTTCYVCGGQITFRTREDGVVYPIHLTGGCWGSARYGFNSTRPISIRTITYSFKEQKDFCELRACPKCHEMVFFVKHKEGEIRIDSLR